MLNNVFIDCRQVTAKTYWLNRQKSYISNLYTHILYSSQANRLFIKMALTVHKNPPKLGVTVFYLQLYVGDFFLTYGIISVISYAARLIYAIIIRLFICFPPIVITGMNLYQIYFLPHITTAFYSYWQLFSLQLRDICCQKMLLNYKTSSKRSWLWLTVSLERKVKQSLALKLHFYVMCYDTYILYFHLHFTGNYIEQFSQKLQRNEMILRDELKLLLHLCQSADDMVIARDAIYRYSISFVDNFLKH